MASLSVVLFKLDIGLYSKKHPLNACNKQPFKTHCCLVHRSIDYVWGLLFKSVSVQVYVERVMEVLKEFLETSTIHGLFYISNAKVSHHGVQTLLHKFVSEQVDKGLMDHSCSPGLLGRWLFDREVLLQLAVLSCLHLDQHSSFRRS